MKKFLSVLLTVATLIGIMSVFSAPAFAAKTTAFDILTTSKYAKVYTLSSSGRTIPYTTASLTNRGTITYGKSSTAYIDNKTDELYLCDVGKNSQGTYWAKVSYPIGSNRAYAYIALSAITSNNGSHAKTTSTGKFYCAYRKGVSTSSSYYVDKGDTVYLIATSGSNYQILYPISSGKWRIGWCSKTNYNKYCGIPVTSVTLNKTSVTLSGQGATVKLTATVKPTNATNKTITWKSSNTSVATVSSSGKVTAVGNGTVTITATATSGKKATAKVTVKNCGIPVTSVTLNKTSVTLNGQGATVKLTATVKPTNATNKTITWKSSNTSVATVSSSGKVTAVSNGTATITATATSGKKATAKVTVKNCGSYSISNNILTVNGVRMYEYPIGTQYTSSRYANVNGEYVDMYGIQCCGYARYIQTKLYGMHYYNSNSNFPNLSGSENVKPTTTSKLKSLITSAGVGAHIRTGANVNGGKHSMIIIEVTSTGFTITDANSDWNNTIRVKTYTWSEYLNSSYGQSGFRYIEIYKG